VQRDAGLQYRDCTQDSLDSTVDRLAGNQDDSPPEAEDVDTDGAGEGRCVAECGLEGEGGGVGGGGGKFTLGAEDGAELIEEFSFTLKYCQEAGPAELAGELERLQSAGPPPPGHWAGAPRGPAQGWSRTGSLSGYSARCSGGYWGPGGDSEPAWGDEDAISDLIAIKRVDSRDVVYETKQKTTKFVGKYVMGDILGEGSYAKVKEAIDSQNLIRRAVKIMKKRKLRKIPNGEANVQREIQLLSQLDHPNVMKLVEVLYNEEKGKIYMVLEYCCAVLKDMLDQTPDKRFPVWQSHDYFTQLLAGLSFLHAKGIIHKDIKPGNLLLDQAGILKIADFGVCERLEVFAVDDTIVTSQGTPAFQPPEVANGWETFSGYKIDVWSCGVTLYNFTTGNYPFQGETIFKLFEQIGKCEFSVPSYVDKPLESLVRAMLVAEPAARPDIDTLRQHDWCRRRFPRTGKAVSAPPHEGDPLLSTTVLPYLENLHSSSPTESASASQMDLSQEPAVAAPPAPPRLHSTNHRLVRKKSKTTSCIKLKNGCKSQ